MVNSFLDQVDLADFEYRNVKDKMMKVDWHKITSNYGKNEQNDVAHFYFRIFHAIKTEL